MPEELKLKIIDPKKTEESLLAKGATYLGAHNYTDTYFHQPAGKVMKISENEHGAHIVHLTSDGNKWRIDEVSEINNAQGVINDYANQIGKKKVLHRRSRTWKLDQYKLNINSIEGLGDFLIIEGEGLDALAVMKMLDMENPKFITTSFDNI